MLVSTLEEVAIATECCSAITMDTLPSIIHYNNYINRNLCSYATATRLLPSILRCVAAAVSLQ